MAEQKVLASPAEILSRREAGATVRDLAREWDVAISTAGVWIQRAEDLAAREAAAAAEERRRLDRDRRYFNRTDPAHSPDARPELARLQPPDDAPQPLPPRQPLPPPLPVTIGARVSRPDDHYVAVAYVDGEPSLLALEPAAVDRALGCGQDSRDWYLRYLAEPSDLDEPGWVGLSWRGCYLPGGERYGIHLFRATHIHEISRLRRRLDAANRGFTGLFRTDGEPVYDGHPKNGAPGPRPGSTTIRAFLL